MAKDKILEIKKLVKHECDTLGFDLWFYNVHLLAVEKFAKLLLEKLPKADKKLVMLGVWLHDLQNIRCLKGDHAKIGAREAVKVLKKFKYNKDMQNKVKEIILSHTCSSNLFPESLEGKILASADAMSHYINDFYLQVAVTGERDVKSLKKWALEKLERDYNKKIYFDFARKIIKKRHDILKTVFTMN